MKSLVTVVVLLSCPLLYCQNIYNSSDVKFKAPLKQNWAYKTSNVILNQIITETVCFINTLDGINAISLSNGKELWKYTYPAKPVLSSVVTFSNEFAVYITYNYDEQTEIGTSALILVELANGKEKWIKKFEETWYKPTPFLDDKNVYCIAGPPDDWEENKDYNKMELYKATIFAFSLEDGKIIWQQDLWDDESELIKVEDNQLFVIHDFDVSDSGKPKNKLSCFSALDGAEIWKYNPSGMITKAFIGNVHIRNNIVYACPLKGTLNSISAISLESGKEI